MGKRSYGHVEKREQKQYAGDVPKPGIYDFKLTSAKEHKVDGDTITTEWIFEIIEGPYEGWPGWVYTNNTTAAWKEVQVLEAIGYKAPDQDEVDFDYARILKKAGPVRCKVKNEQYEGETKGKITTVMAPPGGASTKKAGKSKEKTKDDPF